MRIIKFAVNKHSAMLLAIVERNDPHHPFVTCKITPHSWSKKEWYYGEYCKSLDIAHNSFNARLLKDCWHND